MLWLSVRLFSWLTLLPEIGNEIHHTKFSQLVPGPFGLAFFRFEPLNM